MIRNGPSGCAIRNSCRPPPRLRERGNTNRFPCSSSIVHAAPIFARAGFDSALMNSLTGREKVSWNLRQLRRLQQHNLPSGIIEAEPGSVGSPDRHTRAIRARRAQNELAFARAQPQRLEDLTPPDHLRKPRILGERVRQILHTSQYLQGARGRRGHLAGVPRR